jgi:hypothetical protein
MAGSTSSKILWWAAVAALSIVVGILAWRAEMRLRSLDRVERLERHARQSSEERARAEEEIASVRRTLRDLVEEMETIRARSRAAAPRAAAASSGTEAPENSQERIAELEEAIEDLDRRLRALEAREPLRAGGPSAFLATRGDGSPAPRSNPGAASWSVQQLLGPPDTFSDGDHATAWASLEPDGGHEWVEAEFERDLVPSSLVIRETFNPGAVVKVEAADGSGDYHVVWAGQDPTRQSPGELVISFPRGAFATRKVLIHLDTTLVSGWNEIDAVGLRSRGRTYWAVAARAGSSYADRAAPALAGEAEPGR